MNYKRALKLETLLDAFVSYSEPSKRFKVSLKKDVIVQDQMKKIDKMGLKIVALARTNDGELTLFLKNKSALAQIVIGVLTVEVLLFSLTIFVLLSKTNFR